MNIRKLDSKTLVIKRFAGMQSSSFSDSAKAANDEAVALDFRRTPIDRKTFISKTGLKVETRTYTK